MANGCNIFGPKDKDGMSCCDKHDKHYVSGDIGKIAADKELFNCIKDAGHPIQAGIMFAALTVIGAPMWLKYRARDKWGWFPKEEDGKK